LKLVNELKKALFSREIIYVHKYDARRGNKDHKSRFYQCFQNRRIDGRIRDVVFYAGQLDHWCQWTREEKIFRSKWKWVSRDAAATAAKWAPSGLPNCCAFIRNLCGILG